MTTNRNDLSEMMTMPGLKAGLLSAGALSVANSPQEFRQFVAAGMVSSARIIKAE